MISDTLARRHGLFISRTENGLVFKYQL